VRSPLHHLMLTRYRDTMAGTSVWASSSHWQPALHPPTCPVCHVCAHAHQPHCTAASWLVAGGRSCELLCSSDKLAPMGHGDPPWTPATDLHKHKLPWQVPHHTTCFSLLAIADALPQRRRPHPDSPPSTTSTAAHYKASATMPAIHIPSERRHLPVSSYPPPLPSLAGLAAQTTGTRATPTCFYPTSPTIPAR